MKPLSVARIREFPTVSGDVIARQPTFCPDRLHESLFRSYQILARVKWLLTEGASTRLVLQEIEEMESEPNQTSGADPAKERRP